MAGRNGGRGSYWSNRQETGSIVSSSTSGTIVSTAYPSSASRPSTVSVDVAMHFLSLEEAEEEATEEVRIRILVQEFLSVPAPSSNRSIKVGDISVVERWLEELGVGWVWVVSLNDYGASAGEELDRAARSWIRALDQIARTFCFMRPLFLDPGSVGLPSIHDEEGEPVAVAEKSLPDQYHLALFIQETMLKMFVFVDFLVVLDPDADIRCEMQAPYLRVSILLLVCTALLEASTKISLASHLPPSAQVQRIQGEIASLLSAQQAMVTEAIRGTIEAVWAHIMGLIEDGDHSPRTQTPNELSDIHEVTRSVTFHIGYLRENYWSLCPIVFEAASPSLGKYVTGTGDSFDELEIQMISCLEEKLAKRSQCFPDKGLKYLFLINNLYYISEHSSYASSVLTPKIQDHVQTYLQESWAPVFSCFSFTQPRCFGKSYSPLHKFESAFKTNYNIQKQWKVPHPAVRHKLRTAITKKIISLLDDNCVSTPKFTPDKLEEMLQELFEG